MSFVRIVRPNQTNDVSPPRVVPPSRTAEDPPENVVLEFGENGSGRIIPGTSDFSISRYMDATAKEFTGGGLIIPFSFPAITFQN